MQMNKAILINSKIVIFDNKNNLPPRWIENRFFFHVGLKKNFYLNIVNSWVSYERKWPVYYENGNRFGQKLWTKNINIQKLHIKLVLKKDTA